MSTERVYDRWLKPRWYNKGGRKFRNGITWVRFGYDGPGLWWRDIRVSARTDGDPKGFKFPVGPYRVKALRSNRV